MAAFLCVLLVMAMARRPASFEAIRATGQTTYRIDLNTAGVDQLSLLPGVGPPTAQKIIDYRQTVGPFTSVGEIENVPGIAGKKRAAIEPWARVR